MYPETLQEAMEEPPVSASPGVLQMLITLN